MEWAGKDATVPFDEVGHSSDANEILKQLKIGEVAIGDRKSETSPDKPTKRSKRLARLLYFERHTLIRNNVFQELLVNADRKKIKIKLNGAPRWAPIQFLPVLNFVGTLYRIV